MSSNEHRPHAFVENIDCCLDDAVLHPLNIDVNKVDDSVRKQVHKWMGRNFFVLNLPADIIGLQGASAVWLPLSPGFVTFGKYRMPGRAPAAPLISLISDGSTPFSLR